MKKFFTFAAAMMMLSASAGLTHGELIPRPRCFILLLI